jgi:hypothetical protein
MDTSSINSNAFRLLLAIGECHRRLRRHAIQLRELTGVRAVTHLADMPDLADDGYRLEEYVDAELHSGEAVSWCLEMTVAKQHLVVEADVRRNRSEGQDVIFTLGEYTYATDAACAAELSDIAKRLCSANPFLR